MKNYEQKAIITTIRATSKCTVKIRDNFYSIEYVEERAIPDIEDIDIDEERAILWDDVNAVVDNQISDIVKTFK